MTPRKRLAADAFKKERGRWAKVKQSRPKKDPKYLDWIRLQWCWVCQYCTGSEAGTRHVEACHTGVRGLRQKAPDREAIPLCVRHHRTGKESHHALQKQFWKHHRLDREAIMAYLNRLYESETGRKL